MLPAVAVMMFGSLSATPSGKCPPVAPLTYTPLLANLDDCSTYYSCSYFYDGTLSGPVLMPCPDGMYFNPKLDLCDWPHSFDTSHCNGNGGGNGSGNNYCWSGGPGSNACSIDAGIDIMGFGVSAACSVSCDSGYYACCGLRCTCKRY
jgi:hypothetical protein